MLDHEAHAATAQRWVAAAREQGALATLPVALSGVALGEVLAGRLDVAEDMAAQAAEITAATGAPGVPGAVGILQMILLAWRGREEARAAVDAVTADAVARGQGLGVVSGLYSLTVLELGLGRYAEARDAALRVFDDDPLYFGSASLADVVEATVRSGDVAGAEAALERLSERAPATQTPWAMGLLARSCALLAPKAEAEAHYLEAIRQLERSGLPPELGRAHLLYGEWLRRQRRRRDAREHLRQAYELLESMGIGGFAQRAKVELQATGERARARVDETRDDLTAQERQVAQLAAEGQSNADIAAHLFISPHTVAYHLRKVYAKLDIGSRNRLARALGEQS
jgi:DNA-binding CsgD family transcriptional regulator